jgi:putative cardiolipin synthase
VHAGYPAPGVAVWRAGVLLHVLRARGGARTKASKFGSAGASLHAKAYVLDGARGFVGSFNFDPRSADLNTEMGVMFEDAGLAADVRREYERLAAPALSYRATLDADGRVRWIDGAITPPRVLTEEPETDAMTRLRARLVGWLPIESQL